MPNLVQRMDICLLVSLYYFIENFILINSFLSSLSLLRRPTRLRLREVPLLWLKKWARLAILYYPLLFLVYSIVPRIYSGAEYFKATWSVGEDCYTTSNIVQLALFASNLYYPETVSYRSCFIQAWPFQLDLQMYLLVPLLVLLYQRWPKLAVATCFLMVLISLAWYLWFNTEFEMPVAFAQLQTFKYGTWMASRPTAKLQNVGQGFLLAVAYTKSNQIKRKLSRCLPYRHLDKIGYCLLVLCVQAMWLFGCAQDPFACSRVFSIYWLSLSRPLWVFATCLVLYHLLTSSSPGFVSAFLSHKLFLIAAPAMPVYYLVTPSILEAFFATDWMEPGDGKPTTVRFIV